MPDKGTKKKLTKVGGTASDSGRAGEKDASVPVIDKGKAKGTRLFAIIMFVVAIGFEVGAIAMLQNPPFNSTGLIILIVADLLFAVAGSVLWKKANRLDPASEKEKVRFFIQNQLGLIIALIAFLPLVILIFTNKDLKGKQKSLVGAVAIIALLIASVVGIDLNPPSVEKYADQVARVESLSGANHVYWTKSGRSYHLYSDCSYINTDRTTEIFEGTVDQARELKNITDLCDRCANRAEREKGGASQEDN